MTSTVFPKVVSEILAAIFDISDDSDLIQYIQEIIDTVDTGVMKVMDEDPDFNPLSGEAYKMINASGLRQLKSIIFFLFLSFFLSFFIFYFCTKFKSSL